MDSMQQQLYALVFSFWRSYFLVSQRYAKSHHSSSYFFVKNASRTTSLDISSGSISSQRFLSFLILDGSMMPYSELIQVGQTHSSYQGRVYCSSK